MADYKQLCAELLDRLKGLYDELVDSEMGWVPAEAQELMTRTHAALAEPEPDVPTLDEIDDLCAEHSFCYEDSEGLECLLLIITDALARWGNQSPSTPPQ